MDKSISVLVVEDILSARETVVHMLRALGFSDFLEAENGVAALDILQKHRPGLIISDWNMPKMNGVGLLRAVRSDAALRDIPFVFLTSKSEIEDVALASDGGVSAYLVKPVTIRALDETLQTVLQGRFEQDFTLICQHVAEMRSVGRHAEADDLLSRFEQQHPEQVTRIRFQRVLIFMETGEYIRAEGMLCELLAANSLFTRGWEILARLQSLQGKWDEALLAVEKAITISPNNPEYFVQRGTILLHREELPEARKYFMTALNIDRKNDQIKQDIWNAYVDLGYVDEVERDFGTYIFSSLTCDTLNNMAVAYRRKGELKKAVDIYRAALAKEPDNPKILFNAAVAYVSRKQYDKGVALLKHALYTDPRFEKASELLSKISNIHVSDEDTVAAQLENA